MSVFDNQEALRDFIREEAKAMIRDCLSVRVSKGRTAVGWEPQIEVEIYLDGDLVSSDSVSISS